jgi:hypothetical protein
VLGAVDPLEDEPVDVLTGEANLDPAPRPDLFVQLGRDEVVEGTVEVREGDVDEDPGDRQLRCGVDRLRSGGRRDGLLLGGSGAGAREVGHQRQLSRLVVLVLVVAHEAECSSRRRRAISPSDELWTGRRLRRRRRT